MNTMQQVLGAVCTAVATFLLAMGQATYLADGGSDAAAAFTQGSQLVFVFALVMAVVSFVLASRIKSKRRAAVSVASRVPVSEASR